MKLHTHTYHMETDQTTRTVIYLSGPMTGYPDHNYPAFNAAAKRLRAAGYLVINPAENFGGDTSRPRAEYLRIDAKQVADATAIAMLPGWERSEGARDLELFLAVGHFKLPVVDAETLEPIPDRRIARAMVGLANRLLNQGGSFYRPFDEATPAKAERIGADDLITAAEWNRQTTEFLSFLTPRLHTEDMQTMGFLSDPRAQREYATKTGSDREQFTTGSQRDSSKGKGRYDLLPPGPVHRLALLYERGAKHYGPNNWQRGQPISRLMESLIRHAFNYLEGERTEDHLAAVAWNAFAAMYMEDQRPEMQDIRTRPGYSPAAKHERTD